MNKLLKIRLWNKVDDQSTLASDTTLRWSDNIEQTRGEILIVSQFTLLSQLKGNKVDFHRAMRGSAAKELYDSILARLELAMPGKIQSGTFGAMMQVEIINDGRKTDHSFMSPKLI